MKTNKEIAQAQDEYLKKYSKIIVTYHDNVKKEFSPIDWATFEKGVRKISKNIEFIELTDREKVEIAYPDVTDEDYNDFDKKFKELCELTNVEFLSTSEMIDYLMKMDIEGVNASEAGEAQND